MSNILTKIRAKVKECEEKAEAHYGEPMPGYVVKFDLTGTTAGMHVGKRKSRTHTLRFNLKLAKENEDDFLNNTVPHEFAHLIQRWQDFRKGTRSKPHGIEWKQIMGRVFHLYPSVTHKYDVTNVARNTKPYTWGCTSCSYSIDVGQIKHGKLNRNTNQFRCPRCYSPIEFRGKLTKQDFKNTLAKRGLREVELD